MDQKVIAGIGNYLKAEALYRARIHLATVSDVDDDLEALRVASLTCIRQSLRRQGRHSARLPITRRRSFERPPSRFQCYNRRVDPDGNEVLRFKTPDKRTTHWVPDRWSELRVCNMPSLTRKPSVVGSATTIVVTAPLTRSPRGWLARPSPRSVTFAPGSVVGCLIVWTIVAATVVGYPWH